MRTPRTPIARASLSFARGTDYKVEEAAAAVLENLYGNPAFPSPPIDEAEFSALLQDFQNAMAAMAQGGTAATAEKNNKRRLLVAKLKELAFHVTVKSENNLAILLSSGFTAISLNRTPEPLVAPIIRTIRYGSSGQLIITVSAVRNARGYQMQMAEVNGNITGPWQEPVFYNSSRNMRVNGLTPGKIYAFRVRAVGGSTRESDWSASSSRMSP
jgi:hypothetical protein